MDGQIGRDVIGFMDIEIGRKIDEQLDKLKDYR